MAARIKRIESPKNPAVRETLDLARKGRGMEGGAFLIEGPNLIEAALASRVRFRLLRAFITDEAAARHPQIYHPVKERSAELYECHGDAIKRLSDTETPQGIIALVELARPWSLDDLLASASPLIVIADGIQDPGNLGALVRTAEAAGASGMISLEGTCDAYSSGKAMRASAGSAFNLPMIKADRSRIEGMLAAHGVRLAVADSHRGASVFNADLRGPLAMAFGNEGAGISEDLKRSADLLIRVPLMGKAESLNVAASAAVCLFEALRQRSAR